MKFKVPKFHTPTFHIGGRKYKVGNYANFYVGYSDGRIRGHYRQGWRQRDHDSDGGVFVPSSRSVVSMLGSRTSARKVFDSSPGRSLGNGYR